jgi:GntR family transcriptional regulator
MRGQDPQPQAYFFLFHLTRMHLSVLCNIVQLVHVTRCGMWSLRITPGSSAPIYQQIVSQIRHAIISGAVSSGDLLPSVRSLAEQLLINPNTVAKAYADLSKDGLVETLPGRGLAVTARRAGMGLTRGERLRRVDPMVEHLMHEAVALELTPEDVQELLAKKWKALEGAVSAQSSTVGKGQQA